MNELPSPELIEVITYQWRLMDMCVNAGLGVFKGQMGRWVMSVSTDSRSGFEAK
ncbi:MAG: hypothetical protein KME16_27475 [Scytolyngbya sp. HA4215-MV1]|nr:hypothetical protein [Scytolyngbya sp. HA4215-MV1]